jgi:tRNA/tmRNA/rRNA uracil-C5-methylase (TrmA/RlmC/RlmD family)
VADHAVLTTTGVVAGGDAIGRLTDGKVVFVEGAVAGEDVAVRIRQQRRDFARAELVEVLVPSPLRVEPPCPYVRAGCGGCQWQHIDPAAQKDLKSAIVADALRRIAHVDGLPGDVPVAVPSSAYRTTVRLGVNRDGVPGYRRRRGHQLVEVESCLIAHPRLAELIAVGRFPGADEVMLRIGVTGGERLAIVSGRPTGRRATISVPSDVQVMGRGARVAVHEEIGSRRWRISAGSFFQSGPAAAQLLVDVVDAAVGDALRAGGRVLDAYAGVGLVGGVLAARRGARLTAVEQHPSAVSDARANLVDLDAIVEAGPVEQWEPAVGQPIDVVVADPPRSGLGGAGVSALAAAGASRLVLVSCDAASFARDVALLGEVGYRLSGWQVADLFPHTAHLEVVGRLDRS